ncbi:MAG: type II secretion system protein GspD [Armatimonadetes bacterium]|nr:type II secretion system protein GspD [Armatimonadota bacterium]
MSHDGRPGAQWAACLVAALLCAAIGAQEGEGRPAGAPAAGGEAKPADKAPEADQTKPEAEKGEEKSEPEYELAIEVGPEGVSAYAVSCDAHLFFATLAKRTGLRMIVDDTVKRKLTVNFTGAKLMDIINDIVTGYGLACSDVDGIFMVSEGIPRTPSSYLLSDIDSIRTRYVLPSRAKALLPVFLQDHVKTNSDQNSVVLSAPPPVLEKFRDDIQQFDIPAAQIMIEVLMVEFTESSLDRFDLELDWGNDGIAGQLLSSIGQIAVRGIAGLPQDFSARINALKAAGKARIRAHPRVATVSGQTATIFIGQQRYVSTPIERGGRSTNYIDAGVRLVITPYTGGTGDILVELSPEVSTMSAVDPVTHLPDKTTRTAETMVLVPDGQTIIIGGLMLNELHASKRKIPILGDLPLIGRVFTAKDMDEKHTELVLFVTPRILSQTGHLPEQEEAELMQRMLGEEEPPPQP